MYSIEGWIADFELVTNKKGPVRKLYSENNIDPVLDSNFETNIEEMKKNSI